MEVLLEMFTLKPKRIQEDNMRLDSKETACVLARRYRG